MGWRNPWVITALIIGAVLLVLFPFVERKVKQPMFNLSLFKIRGFAAGSIAGMVSSMGMMGFMFMIIILFQGIWLPIHGYAYSSVPFWAGIYMLPMTIAMGIFGPIAGKYSDNHGQRWLATTGLIVSGIALLLLVLMPADFIYIFMGILLFVFGAGMGMFTAPNVSAVMSSVSPDVRGSASGMLNTLRNVGTTASMGIFFTILILGLTTTLPHTLSSAVLAAHGGQALATAMSTLPPTEAIFGALLGINPATVILGLLPAHVVAGISTSAKATITARTWFPTIFAPAFIKSLHIVFYTGAAIVFTGALISLLREPLRKSNKGKADKPSTANKSELPDKAVKMKR